MCRQPTEAAMGASLLHSHEAVLLGSESYGRGWRRRGIPFLGVRPFVGATRGRIWGAGVLLGESKHRGTLLGAVMSFEQSAGFFFLLEDLAYYEV